jgi:hypothetical protein
MTAHSAKKGVSWLSLNVKSEAGIAASAPKLAAQLLDAIELYDGGTWLSSRPQTIHVHQAESIAEEVTHIDRSCPYFVVGTSPDLPFDAFVRRVTSWTRDTRGLGQVAVLDPDATKQFNEIVGATHSVLPGTIRTYDVDVDPAFPADARRHRVIGTRRLAGPDAVVQRLLAEVARNHAARREFPSSVKTELRSLIRIEDPMLIEALSRPADDISDHITSEVIKAEPVNATTDSKAKTSHSIAVPRSSTLADEASAYLSQVELVQEILGIETITTESLAQFATFKVLNQRLTDRITQELFERRQQIDDLRFEIDGLRGALEDQELDLAIALDDASRLAAESRWLRSKLADVGEREAYALIPDDQLIHRPESFSELCEMLPTLAKKGVEFTGSVDTVEYLDAVDTIGRVAGVAWDCLITICDYIRARNDEAFTGGLAAYVGSAPAGYSSVSQRKFGKSESESVRNDKKLLLERTFPVPQSVNSEGETVMLAHFKLASLATVSPRMYVLDNYAKDGKVYVGYIGRHLTNTMTN